MKRGAKSGTDTILRTSFSAQLATSLALVSLHPRLAFLSLLTQSRFAIARHAVACACAAGVVATEYIATADVPTALKWVWPIVAPLC